MLIMVRTNGTLPYHCYRATNATDARIGCIPTVTTPPYRCICQFANTGGNGRIERVVPNRVMLNQNDCRLNGLQSSYFCLIGMHPPKPIPYLHLPGGSTTKFPPQQSRVSPSAPPDSSPVLPSIHLTYLLQTPQILSPSTQPHLTHDHIPKYSRADQLLCST
jgi:hypothetical protein